MDVILRSLTLALSLILSLLLTQRTADLNVVLAVVLQGACTTKYLLESNEFIMAR